MGDGDVGAIRFELNDLLLAVVFLRQAEVQTEDVVQVLVLVRKDIAKA